MDNLCFTTRWEIVLWIVKVDVLGLIIATESIAGQAQESSLLHILFFLQPLTSGEVCQSQTNINKLTQKVNIVLQ